MGRIATARALQKWCTPFTEMVAGLGSLMHSIAAIENAMPHPDRLRLIDLPAAQLEPLEVLMTPEWPDAWRDLAYSFFCTLLSQPLPIEGLDAAKLVEQLVLGVAKDLGGTQPYIPTGRAMNVSGRCARALGLLKQGYTYKAAADMCGLTERHVRKLELARPRTGLGNPHSTH